MIIEFLLTCLVLFISSLFGTLVSGGAIFDSLFYILICFVLVYNTITQSYSKYKIYVLYLYKNMWYYNSSS